MHTHEYFIVKFKFVCVCVVILKINKKVYTHRIYLKIITSTKNKKYSLSFFSFFFLNQTNKSNLWVKEVAGGLLNNLDDCPTCIACVCVCDTNVSGWNNAIDNYERYDCND